MAQPSNDPERQPRARRLRGADYGFLILWILAFGLLFSPQANAGRWPVAGVVLVVLIAALVWWRRRSAARA